MLFKILYLPSSLKAACSSSACDYTVITSTADEVVTTSYLLRLFSALKNRLVKNYQSAIKAQVDSIIP